MARQAKTESGTATATAAAPDYQLIRRDLLQPSETNPRKRFPQVSIDELAGSIRDKGIIEPLIVRSWSAKPKQTKNGTDYDKTYEIVCGERRFRAATQAELAELPCIVRALTDDEVLDIQIHENLHREDVHPVDEALGYKFLQERLGCSTAELAARVGQTEHYVVNRLKLNKLIPKAMADLESGKLPIAHALEIAKFSDPDTQLEILQGYVYDDWNEDNTVSLKVLCESINEEYLLQLTKARFDVNSTELRSDGLACVNCPSRTGALPGLFEAYDLKKDDHCLEKACFEAKKQRSIELMRERAATDLGVDAKKLRAVDLTRSYADDGVLGTSEVQKIGDRNANKLLESGEAFQAISVAGDTAGQIVIVKEHRNGAVSTKPVGQEKTPAEKEAFYKRKEEIWNCSVAEVTRKMVLSLAAAKFAKQFKVTGGGEEFVPALCAKIREGIGYNSGVARLAEEAIAGALDLKSLDLSNTYNGTSTEAKIKKLPESAQKQLLYLYIHGHKGDCGSGYWSSQKPILEIAKEWDVDHTLLDAKARVSLSSKKHKQTHDDYLKAIEFGDGKKAPKVPRLYSEKWNKD